MHENMRNFTAPYEFREYPKWVAKPDGTQVIVANAEEEEAIATAFDSAPDREALLAEARALGLEPHHKLGADKLRAMIDQAKG